MLALLLACSDPLPATREARPRRTDGPARDDTVVGRLDALIVRAVPGVRKAVKWNSPFYGIEGQGFFLGIHCFAKYVKIAFFRGSSLRPEPPVGSKDPDARYLHVHEDGAIDEAQFIAWVKQASRLPGWGGGSGDLRP